MEENENIYKRVKRLEDDLRAFKSPQPVGTDSVVTYRLLSNNEWDFDGALPANTLGFGTSAQINFTVTYISRDQIAPFARAFAFAQYNGQTIDYGSNQAGFTNPSGGAIRVADWIFGSTPEELSNPQIMKFEITISGVQYTPIKLKFGVDATDLGQIQIHRQTPSGPALIAYGQ